MSAYRFHSSRPDHWVQPRPFSDASLRLQQYGPLQPMDPPGFWQRLFGRR